MNILITGGSGFLGSHVADYLLELGHKVIIYDLNTSKWLKRRHKMVIGNIEDEKKISHYIKNCDVIYNFAALGDMDEARFKPSETVKTNISSVVKIMMIAKKYNVKRFIQASSIYAISEEGGFYGRSKKAAEDYIIEFYQTFGLPYTILRFGSLYGLRADNNNGIKKLISTAKKNKKVIYRGNKNAVRKYINVLDAAKLSVQAMSNKFKCKILNITGKRKIKVKYIINLISAYLNLKKSNNVYLSEKKTAHYINKPTPFIIKKGENIYLKKEKILDKSIIELIENEKYYINKKI